MTQSFKEGQRVVVLIRNEKDYSGNAGRLMHGHTGTIEKIKGEYVYWPTPKPGYLVLFDEPVALEAYGNSLPITAFWFEAHDLRAEGSL